MAQPINKLRWYCHRILCLVGIHATERVYQFDSELDDFKPDGWFCGVCGKVWEE